MANPIYHSQYTAAQIENLITHGVPIIQNGTWWAWDITTGAYVDTGLSAEGAQAFHGLADDFDDTANYAVGDLVIYDGEFYVCTTAHPAGAWDAADFTSTTVAAQIAVEKARAEAAEALLAPLASPALTGNPTAPTQTALDNSTKIATTAYADSAVAVEKTRAMAAENLKADLTFAQYIALREEEDRQILFGSIVQAVEDTYDELRAAPIHNAITIGGSVYPRMDNTRLGLEAIKGRTVAMNQLVKNGDFADTSIWAGTNRTFAVNNNVASIIASASGGGIYQPFSIKSGHKYLIRGYFKLTTATTDIGFYIGQYEIPINTRATTEWQEVASISSFTAGDNYLRILDKRSFDWDEFQVKDVICSDITQMYGATLADSIYAMEQSTAGSGVAYVRARLPLDYYAYNAGELKAPVVSGWSVYNNQAKVINGKTVTGSNSRTAVSANDEITVSYGSATSASTLLTADMAAQMIGFDAPPVGEVMCHLDAAVTGSFSISGVTFVFAKDGASDISVTNDSTETIPTGYALKNITCDIFVPAVGNSIKLSNISIYMPTALTLPSTTLNGVGAAQDVLECVEVAENDYSLIKTQTMAFSDIGNMNWSYSSSSFRINTSTMKGSGSNGTPANLICARYQNVAYNDLSGRDKVIALAGDGDVLVIKDSAYTDAATFKAAVSGVYLSVERKNPTQTVIAEHLTLAEISAIAENGGIVSIVNSNGDIVQPDLTVESVISRSAQ